MSIFEEMYQNRQFQSWRDFHELVRMLSEAIARGFVEETRVSHRGNMCPDEKWYRDKETGVVYSLIPPDPPATGMWARVDIEDFGEPPLTIQ
jgi:hypothetical protein